MPTTATLEDVLGHLPASLDPASLIRHEVARRTRRSVMTSSVLKVCPSCDTAKPHSDFHRHAGRADGLQSQCRACVSRTASQVTPCPSL